jgi:hypothetical protein
MGNAHLSSRTIQRLAAALVDHRVNLIGGKYLERACEGGLGKRMRVDADHNPALRIFDRIGSGDECFLRAAAPFLSFPMKHAPLSDRPGQRGGGVPSCE